MALPSYPREGLRGGPRIPACFSPSSCSRLGAGFPLDSGRVQACAQGEAAIVFPHRDQEHLGRHRPMVSWKRTVWCHRHGERSAQAAFVAWEQTVCVLHGHVCKCCLSCSRCQPLTAPEGWRRRIHRCVCLIMPLNLIAGSASQVAITLIGLISHTQPQAAACVSALGRFRKGAFNTPVQSNPFRIYSQIPEFLARSATNELST